MSCRKVQPIPYRMCRTSSRTLRTPAKVIEMKRHAPKRLEAEPPQAFRGAAHAIVPSLIIWAVVIALVARYAFTR